MKEKGARVNGIDQLFSKIIEENFPTQRKDSSMRTQGAHRTPVRRRESPHGLSQLNYSTDKHKNHHCPLMAKCESGTHTRLSYFSDLEMWVFKQSTTNIQAGKRI